MKILIVAIFLALSFSGFAQDGDFDLEKISTVEGREYRDILIVDSDEHGLLFRHRQGIAKLPFASLPTNLRMLYEVAAPVETVEEGEKVEETESEDSEKAKSAANFYPLTFTVRTRTYPKSPVDSCGPGPGSGCGPFLWPSHWPRFRPAHHLVNPYCRELAVRDFLYTSGLLPKPPGVFTYRLPHNRPFLY